MCNDFTYGLHNSYPISDDGGKRKPPIGLRPRYIWVEERVQELQAALWRCRNEQSDSTEIWLEELGNHLKHLRENKKY